MKFILIDQLKSLVFNFRKFLVKLLFLILPLLVSAQDIDLFEQFNGRYDFTAIGNTLNTGPNDCNILTQSSADLTLTGNQDLIAARLYWSGSGAEFSTEYPGDYQVTLNGTAVVADRTYSVSSFIGIDFYGASADVTDIVSANGNGTYTLSDLDLTGNIFPFSDYCNSTVDYGGWSLIVIYEDEDNLALNQISLFDGLEVLYQNELIITLGPLDVATDEFAKIGFLAWEGDLPNPNNESLRINNVLINDPPLNPGNNQFNGTNTYTNSTNLYNMDLDVYDLDGLVNPGDTEIEIKMTSDSDLVLINNIITSVNSELPDASIIFEPIEFICNNTVDVNWTVFNINSTGELQAGIPIKFYLEGNEIAQDNTITTIPIDGAETGTVTLPISTSTVPDPFTILAVVDDAGGGVSTVTETNENNNEYQQVINLADVTLSVVLDSDILIADGNAICDGEDQVIGIIPGGLTPAGAAATYQWFLNGVIIPGANNNELTVTQAGTYELEVAYQGCDATDDIIVEFVANPVAGTPNPLVECDEVPNDGFADFDLLEDIDGDGFPDLETEIINGQTDVFVTYHETEPQAEAGTNALTSPYNSSTQTIYARLEENTIGCYDVIELDLIVNAAPAISDPIAPYPLCDNDQNGTEDFDLITWGDDEILNGLTDVTLTYYNTQADADLGDPINEIPTPSAYPSAGAETIWVRAINLDGCVTVSSFELVIEVVDTGDYVEVPLFQVCDDDPLDGITAFDLNIQTPIIQGGDTNLDITYHESQGAADDESSSIDILNPYNSPNQVIYVRVENATTFCYDTFEMELEVISVIGEIPTDIIECDEVPNDGKAIFNLTVREGDILNGQIAVLSYYELEADAEIGDPVNAIADPLNFENTTIDTQTVYVRLEEPILGCFDVVPLILIVNASKKINFN